MSSINKYRKLLLLLLFFIGISIIINFTLKCCISLSFLKHPDLCMFVVDTDSDLNLMQVGSRKQKAVVCEEVML